MQLLHPSKNNLLDASQLNFKYEGIVDSTIQSLKELGADQVEVRLIEEDNFEVYGTAMSLNLVRSIENVTLKMAVISDFKKATAQVNDISPEGLKSAYAALIDSLNASEADPANAFSSLADQAGQTLFIGPQPFSIEGGDSLVGAMDGLRGALASSVAQFLDDCRHTFPNIMVSELGGQYNHHKILLKNTGGTHLRESRGTYELSTLFNAFDDQKSSSFNYASSSPVEVSETTKLIEDPYWRETIARNALELNPIPFEGTLKGNVVFAPSCVSDLLYSLQELALTDASFIKEFSKWRGKLGEQVADPKITWKSMPTSSLVGAGYGITADGFVAKDATIIEDGILGSYMLSLYAANKTGEARSNNPGYLFWLKEGDVALAELIKDVERGVLISRLSGGEPSPNGDFSGVAKNSFLIENGKITHAITEAMATMNLFEVIGNVAGLSSEVHNSGSFRTPYMLSHVVTVTGN